MNQKQINGMIEFHRKAEAAFLRFGQNKNAEQAKKMRERLEVEKRKNGMNE